MATSAPTKPARKVPATQVAPSRLVWGYASPQGDLYLSNHQVDARYRLLPGLSQLRAGLAKQPRVGLWDFSPGYLAVREELEHAAALTGLDADLLRAVVSVESQYQRTGESHAGAVGLMQLMPDTARGLGLQASGQETLRERLSHPQTNLLVGARMLHGLMQRYPYRLDLVLAAYNAGEGAVRRFGNRVPPYRETQRYVTAVSEVYALLKLRDPLMGVDAQPHSPPQVREASAHQHSR